MLTITLLIQCFFSATTSPVIHTFIYHVHFNYYKNDIGIIHFIDLLAYVDLMAKTYISVILIYVYQTFHYKFFPLFENTPNLSLLHSDHILAKEY